MLSRASSNGKLRRSKSSASVKSRRPPPVSESFDPRLARSHALTAASLAMQRHSQRSSGDSRGSFDHGYGEDEVPPLPLRSHSSRYNAAFDTPSRAVTPTRAYSIREGSLEPVPEIPTDAREFGLEDGAPSQPSSYRKLRKAKSMFSTRQRRGQASNSEASGAGFTRTTLRRSLSFFKKPPTVRNRHGYSDPQDIAVQLARDQFLSHLDEQGSPDVSPSAASRPQHQSKPFRKSFRSTSTADSGDGVEGEFWKDRLRRSKSRRFSVSIKNGLRRIFGLSTSQDEPPPVPISPRRFQSSVTESPRSSTGTVIASSEASHLQSPHHGQPELDHMSISTAHKVGSLRTLRSSDSMRTSTSRVSSWTDSTAHNTLTTRHGETDQNQLSAIQEHGFPQQANQTGRVSSASSHHDGYSVFRQPFVSDRSESRNKDIMDSQRVYSALMRRIDEPDPENSGGDDTTPKAARRRKPGFATPTSVGGIRHVPSSESVAQSTLPSTAQSSPSARSHLTIRKRDYHRDSFRLTPQQMAEYNEARHPQQSLNESHSFASEPPMPPGTPTPYGYAASSSRWSGIGSGDDSNTVIMGRQSPVAIPQSPSVYSRTTSGTGPYDDESGYSESEDDRGTVTILASHRLPYSPRKQSVAGDADRVGKHSAEWKEWMNSQMDFNVNPVTSDFHRTHFREAAQIEDDGFSLEHYTGGMPEEPTFDSSRTGIEPQGTEHVRFPLVELTSSSQGNFSRPLRRDSTGPISLGNTSSRRPSIVSAARPTSVTASVSGPDIQPYSTNLSKPPTAYKPRQPESPRFPITPTRESLRNLNSGTPRIRYGLNSPARRQSQIAPLTAVRNRQENTGFSNENQRLDDDGSPVRRRDIESNLSKLEGLHSTISTKRMVDMFLDDRRRVMGSSEDDGLSSEPAFL